MNILGYAYHLMQSETTLLACIVLFGLLAFCCYAVNSVASAPMRRGVNYTVGTALTLLGVLWADYGAKLLFTDVAVGLERIDIFAIEWLLVGLMALLMAALVLRQALRRESLLE